VPRRSRRLRGRRLWMRRFLVGVGQLRGGGSLGIGGLWLFRGVSDSVSRYWGNDREGEGIPCPCDSRSGQGLYPGKKILLLRGGFRSRLLYLLGLILERWGSGKLTHFSVINRPLNIFPQARNDLCFSIVLPLQFPADKAA